MTTGQSASPVLHHGVKRGRCFPAPTGGVTIAITGATGYIGQRLVRAARRDGHAVLALSRRPLDQPGVAWQAFDLADTGPLALPAHITTVIHLAAHTRTASGSPDTEEQAARRLMDAARAIGADMVFVSSQTAREDAPTPYGRIKWRIERLVLDAGGWVVRPGQVYGGPEQGLFGLLCAQVRRLPALPAFLPSPIVQPVHVDDLAQALLRHRQAPPGSLLCVADPVGVSFTGFLRAIARGRTTRRPLVVPVPVLLVQAAARALGPARAARLGLDRLCSLFALPPMDTAADLQRLSLLQGSSERSFEDPHEGGLNASSSAVPQRPPFFLRPLDAGMSRSGRARRALLREGRVLLAYILRDTPRPALVRRYVRAVETLRSGAVLPLPDTVLRHPALLALLDGAPGVPLHLHDELSWRLGAALMLAEASPQGAHRFLGLDAPEGGLRSAWRIARAVMSDALRRIAQWVLRPWLARTVRRRVGP